MKRPKDRLRRVVVIGATPSGIAASNKLGELGIPVTLVDNDPDLDRKLADDTFRMKSGIPFNYAHRPGIIRILRNPRIQCILPAHIDQIKHTPQGFSIRLTTVPTYVDPAVCTLCGRCKAACPHTGREEILPIRYPGRFSLPGRPVIDKRQTPLCQAGCPLQVNAQGYVALTRAGKYREALALIRRENVLPGICGRICTHPCEIQCRRGQLDDPVSIRAIKRFLTDYEIGHPDSVSDEIPPPPNGRSIAVIGSGPAGLAAAAELARAGCRVSILEKEPQAGGLLRYGIGPHRLPRAVLDADLDRLQQTGVTFHLSRTVSFPDELDILRHDYDGVLVATGAWTDRRLGVPGENRKGVEGCLSFLHRFHQHPTEEIRKQAVVIGDGNAAFDLARTLLRAGADVTLVSWFGLDEIPADPEEVHAAAREGVNIRERLRVTAFEGENGTLSRLVCIPTRPGPPDASGIRWPVAIRDAGPVYLDAQAAFVAIGQGPPDPAEPGVPRAANGYIAVSSGYRTTIPGVYASGDAVSGPSTVVLAMSRGKAAARQMLDEICGFPDAASRANRPADTDFPEIAVDTVIHRRIEVPEISLPARRSGFAEVSLGFSESQVRLEAGRCLQCGVCAECMECVDACGSIRAIRHEELPQTTTEHAGVVIIADPAMAPAIRGDDILRAYGPASSRNDIQAMLVRGFSTAAQAVVRLSEHSLLQKGKGLSFNQPDPVPEEPGRIGVFVCRCNDSLGWLPEMDGIVEELQQLPHVVHAGVLLSACIPDGTASILRTVRDKGITRIVLGSCVCCPLDFVCSACTDQRSRLKHDLFTATGISRAMAATCNIRGEALSLLPRDPGQALLLFEGLLHRSVRNAGRLHPFPSPVRNYSFISAVIGDSVAAQHSAGTLAEAGMDVFWFADPGQVPTTLQNHPNIHWFSDATVTEIGGTLGDFTLMAKTVEGLQQIHVGTVILGEKSRKRIGYIHQAGLPARTIACGIQQAGTTGIPFFYPGMTSISGLFVADPPGIPVSTRQKGEAAAMLVAAALPRGPRKSKGYTVTIRTELCRGCGRCVDVCPYHAVSLHPRGNGGWAASVDAGFCKGCGNCISVCPSNAADSPYRSQLFFEQTLEEILCQPN